MWWAAGEPGTRGGQPKRVRVPPTPSPAQRAPLLPGGRRLLVQAGRKARGQGRQIPEDSRPLATLLPARARVYPRPGGKGESEQDEWMRYREGNRLGMGGHSARDSAATCCLSCPALPKAHSPARSSAVSGPPAQVPDLAMVFPSPHEADSQSSAAAAE